MGTEAHVRIDEGVKRGPRRKLDRHPKAQTFLSAYSLETRQKAVADAIESLERGETTEQIAQRHNLPGRTLRAWLLGDERADVARGRMISYELARTLSDIGEATEPLPLARAREEFRAWSWIAERRESRLYGQKQEVSVTGTVTVSHALQAISERRQAQIEDQSGASLPNAAVLPVIDVNPLPEEPV